MSTPEARTVRVPALTTATLTRWLAATGVGLVAVSAWAVTAHPSSVWLPGVPFMVVFAVAAVLLGWVTREVDVTAGTITQTRAGVVRRRVHLGSQTRTVLLPTAAGTVVLGLRGPDERTYLYLPLLTVGPYGQRTQPAPVLRALARTLADHHADQAGTVRTALHAQAEAVEAGATPEHTPLARLLTHGVLRPAPPTTRRNS